MVQAGLAQMDIVCEFERFYRIHMWKWNAIEVGDIARCIKTL